MKKYLLALLCIAMGLSLQSCHIGTSGSWKDGHIDPAIRREVAPLNQKLFTSLMSNDIAGVKSLMSPVLIEKLERKTDTMVNTVSNTFKGTDYKLLNEFYTKNTTTNLTNTLFSGFGDNDYTIGYLALNEEMYVSVIVSKNLPVNCLILAIYGKYDKSWKLNILQIGQYDILGKIAPEYYAAAKSDYKKGNLINTADNIIIASELANPAAGHFKYKSEDEMKDFYAKIINEANTQYKFPLTLNDVPKQAQIFSINPQFINDGKNSGVYPLVDYLTTIKLTDTAALKAQNQLVQKAIGKQFKGIDQDNNYILYQVFDIFPRGTTPTKYVQYVQKLK